MPETIVRPYRSEDRDAVRRVCVATGYMGSPITPQWRDAQSFADVFSGYYTDHEPESLLVADRDGDVVGYLLGCRDTAATPNIVGAFARAAVTRGIAVRPGTARFVWRSVVDSLAATLRRDVPATKVLDPRWPAHLHINLLPEIRGHGTGAVLVRTWLERLTGTGVPGCHLETLAENTEAIAFFSAMGFRAEGGSHPVPGLRAPDGSRHHTRLMVQPLH